MVTKATKDINKSMAAIGAADYAKSIEGLSLSQAKLLLSTQGLDAEQQKNLLLQAGLISSSEKMTASHVAQALSNTTLKNTEQERVLIKAGLMNAQTKELLVENSCTEAKLREALVNTTLDATEKDAIVTRILGTTTNSSYSISFDVLTASIWKNIKAMGKWLVTNPVGWVILASTAVLGLVKAYDECTDSVEEVKEKTDNLLQSYNSAISEANSNAKTIESLASRYGELSKGVNNLGENISLTADEYSEYNDIVNQIAEMSPNLVDTYTTEGNAILSLKGNVEELKEAYKEAQKEAYNLLITSGEDSDGNDILKNYQNQLYGNTDSFTVYGYESGTKDALDILTKLQDATNSPENFAQIYQNLMDSYTEKNLWHTDKIQNALTSSGISDLLQSKELSWDGALSQITQEDLDSIKYSVQAAIQTYQAEVDSQLKNVQTLANAYMMTNSDYEKLGEQSKTAVSLLINSIDENIANEFKDKTDVGGYVGELVASISSNKNVQKTLSDLFTMDTSDMSINEIKSNVDTYISIISDAIGEDSDKLKIRLGFEDMDNLKTNYDNSIKQTKERFKPEPIDLTPYEKNLNNEYQKIQDWGLGDYEKQIKDGAIQSVFGNVDMDKRTIITWSDELKQTYKDALDSWDYNPEVGSIDTVFGGSDRFGEDLNGTGWEVAFTPILPDGRFLSQDTVYDYINTILAEAYANDGKVTEDELAKIDAQGRQIGNTFVQGIFAGVDDSQNYENNGNWAETVGRLMHFSGDFGAVNIAQQAIEDAKKQDNDFDWESWFTENSINTQEEIDRWNRISESANTAVEARINYTKISDELDTSFIDALNSADNKEIKDELLELAKSGEITPEVLSSTEEYANLLKNTDTSAENAMNQILDLLTAQEKLAGFSQGLDKLKSAYEEFKDEDIGFVTAETLQSLPDSFKKLPEFDLFSQIVGDPTSGAEAIQQAFNDIVKAYMLSQDVLQGLVGASEHEIQSYIANFKQLGVTNAEEVVNIAVEALNSENELLNSAEAEYIDYLNNKDDYDTDYLESVASKNGQLASALGEAYKADYDNWCDLLEKKSELYNDFIERIGGSYNPEYSVVGNMAANGQNMSPDNIAKMSEMQSQIYQAQYEADKLKDQLKVNLAPINTNFGTKYSPSTSSGSKDGSEDTVNTETYDHIERKLEVIAKKTEKVGEAFEKAFSLNATNIRYKEYLSQIDEEISANNTAIQTYQAKLNSIGLSADWIAKIQNGEYSITDVTDDALNERISLYQEYYDKLESCQETVEELEKKRLEAQNQYAEKIIDIYDREIEKLDRIIERREALVKLKEAFGNSASSGDLKYEQKYYQKELNKLEEQNDKLIALRATTKKNSDAWNTYTEQINENKSSILELTETIAELSESLANLPLEKLERALEKNDTKRTLNDAKLSNATSLSGKNSLLNSQIKLENSDNKATQVYAKATAKAVTTNISSIKTAKTSDKKGLSKTEKKKVDSYYKQIQKYTKSKKAIPSSLITKLANAGHSNLVQACSNYNAALSANETAQETAKLTAEETKANVNDLKKQQFDNIQENYDRKASQIQAKADNIDSKIALLQAKGYQSSASWYNGLIAYEKQNLANSQSELKALKAKQNEMTKYTDAWWEAEDAINSVTQEINDSTLALQEFLNTQREINFENFEFLQGQIGRISEEAQYFIDLMQNKEMTGDNGLNNYGLTAIGLYYQQIETGLNQAQDYAKKIAEIDQELLKEPYNTELLTQKQEYIDAQRDIMTNNESLKKSIADLVKDGYDSLLDSLGEVIDKYKEVLQNAKDAHDYQKNISDKTENINTLQKQITAYSSMTGNDEVASKLQSLQAEYKDAQEDLQETLYDKYISDTEEVLDEMLDELETFIEELSKNIEELYKIGVESIDGNVGTISETLKTLAEDANTPMSDEMTIVWEDNSSITSLTTAIEEVTKAIKTAIDKENDISAFEAISSKYDKTDYDSQISNAKTDLNYANSRISSYGIMESEDSLLAVRGKFEAENASLQARIKTYEKKISKTKDKSKIADYNAIINDLNQQIISNNAEINTIDTELAKVRELTSGLENAQTAYNNAVNAKTSAMDNNKTVIKELLSAIANDYPTGSNDEQTELDKKVSDILGMTSYLSKDNVSQLAELFGVRDNESSVLQALKNAGFATGGIVKAVGEDGIGLVRNGEGFVMPEVVPIMQDILGAMPKIDTFIDTTLSNLPSNRGNIEQTIEFGDIYMSGVNDPQEFSKQLISTFQNEAKVQKMFGTFVNNSLTGKNSLSIRKY